MPSRARWVLRRQPPYLTWVHTILSLRSIVTAIDLLAVVEVVGLAVADIIASLAVAYDHAFQQRRAALVLTEADEARIKAALTGAYRAKNTRRA